MQTSNLRVTSIGNKIIIDQITLIATKNYLQMSLAPMEVSDPIN